MQKTKNAHSLNYEIRDEEWRSRSSELRDCNHPPKFVGGAPTLSLASSPSIVEDLRSLSRHHCRSLVVAVFAVTLEVAKAQKLATTIAVMSPRSSAAVAKSTSAVERDRERMGERARLKGGVKLKAHN
ncbi:hypothetical protein TIFTF001_006003 [Ficus carica]|uniref:Uncharacterized protein n=1 Tax=Ficus carica TaxID=3494 RepID=A0AA87ZGF9_FICCA|nr:hypothetical protein TIFTF001_006003 [Ficus carica]